MEGVEEIETKDGEVTEVVDDVLIERRDGLLILTKDEPDAVADDHTD